MRASEADAVMLPGGGGGVFMACSGRGGSREGTMAKGVLPSCKDKTFIIRRVVQSFTSMHHLWL